MTDEFRTIQRVKSRVARSLKELAITTTTASPTSLTVPKFLLISSIGHDFRFTSIRPLIKVLRTGFFTEVGLGKKVVLIGLGNPYSEIDGDKCKVIFLLPTYRLGSLRTKKI